MPILANEPICACHLSVCQVNCCCRGSFHHIVKAAQAVAEVLASVGPSQVNTKMMLTGPGGRAWVGA